MRWIDIIMDAIVVIALFVTGWGVMVIGHGLGL